MADLQRIARVVARAVVLGAGVLAVAAIVYTSLDARFYRADDRRGWEHPTLDVAVLALAALLETALAYAVLLGRTPGQAWLRALIGLVLLAPFGLVVSEVRRHDPWFWWVHLAWVSLVSASFLIAALVSFAHEAIAWLLRRTDPGPP